MWIVSAHLPTSTQHIDDTAVTTGQLCSSYVAVCPWSPGQTGVKVPVGSGSKSFRKEVTKAGAKEAFLMRLRLHVAFLGCVKNIHCKSLETGGSVLSLDCIRLIQFGESPGGRGRMAEGKGCLKTGPSVEYSSVVFVVQLRSGPCLC